MPVGEYGIEQSGSKSENESLQGSKAMRLKTPNENCNTTSAIHREEKKG